MPQLMPFFWINSLFMVIFILTTCIFLFFMKDKEVFNKMFLKKKSLLKFNMLW